jgi:hypothetical protein
MDETAQNNNSSTDTTIDFKAFAKQNLIKTVNDFFNELGLSFEDKLSNLPSIKKHFKLVCKESHSADFDKFVQSTIQTLHPCAENINQIICSQRKIKTHQYEFLKNIHLRFHSDLGVDFNVFTSESKSTKKTLVQYLYTMLMLCNLYNSAELNINIPPEQLQAIGDLFSKKPATPPPKDVGSNSRRHISKKLADNPMDSISSLMDSVMANPDIVNIAKEISVDIQSQNIDPMSMINGLMSGKPSAQLEGLISKIGSKIDQKINSGEIDSNVLEQQAVNILNNVNLGETLKHLGSSSRQK